MESTTELVIDYKRNEIRAKFFPFRPCSPFQKPRTAGSLIPESFFWEWEQVDINKIKYPSNTDLQPSHPTTPPKLYSLQVMHGTGQDDSYAWNRTGRQLCMETGQEDSYAWNRTTVMAGICESLCGKFSSCNTNAHNIHAHQDQQNFFAWQIFSHNIQAYKEIPQRQKKRSIYMYMGKKESNL